MSCGSNMCLKHAMEACHAVQQWSAVGRDKAIVWNVLHVDMSALMLQCLLSAAVLEESNDFQT